jgi:hypothetical protein
LASTETNTSACTAPASTNRASIAVVSNFIVMPPLPDPENWG